MMPVRHHDLRFGVGENVGGALALWMVTGIFFRFLAREEGVRAFFDVMSEKPCPFF